MPPAPVFGASIRLGFPSLILLRFDSEQIQVGYLTLSKVHSIDGREGQCGPFVLPGRPESWDVCRFSGFLIVGRFLIAHKHYG